MEEREYSYRDALPRGQAHRRGAGINPGNRFESIRLHVLGEELDRQWVEHQEADGKLQRVERQVFFDRTQRIINQVSSTADVPFDFTLNPYRGCEHGCIYCFARPYHEFRERCVNYTGVIEWSFFHSSGSHWDSRLIGMSGRLVSRCVR
ncbi:MAG: hypothetical protein IT447_01035 [Phycisphaerales bacterium]|nr:hypothetical protein [Phycisphaerales bacterium]